MIDAGAAMYLFTIVGGVIMVGIAIAYGAAGNRHPHHRDDSEGSRR